MYRVPSGVKWKAVFLTLSKQSKSLCVLRDVSSATFISMKLNNRKINLFFPELRFFFWDCILLLNVIKPLNESKILNSKNKTHIYNSLFCLISSVESQNGSTISFFMRLHVLLNVIKPPINSKIWKFKKHISDIFCRISVESKDGTTIQNNNKTYGNTCITQFH